MKKNYIHPAGSIFAAIQKKRESPKVSFDNINA